MIAPELFDALLTKVEQGFHRDGWDNKSMPILGYLTQRGNSLNFKPLRTGLEKSKDPVSTLYANAESLARGEHPELDQDVAMIATMPGFAGLAFVMEGWFKQARSADQLEAAFASGPIRNQPDRQECRQVAALDLNGRTYGRLRIRGTAPRSVDGGAATPGGRIVEALRLILLAIARHMPDSEAYVSELETLFVMKNQDLVTMMRAHEARR